MSNFSREARMSFVQFDLERWQSAWEHHVRFNLAESGVHPLSVAELIQLAGADLADLEGIRLGYSQADGTGELKRAIAGMYPGASEHNVLVTVGSSEANFITCWTLLRPGDHVAILEPTYRQTWGLAQNFGASVTTFNLLPDRAWDPDPADIERAITPDTKLVIVTNPNNPTGRILTKATCDAIVQRTSAAGAWLLADEVYRGAELDDRPPADSFWGAYEKTIVVGGVSKAYGLPGLRIGWIVAPEDFKTAVYARHDYTVICPTPLSDYLARLALDERVRERIRQRTRTILRTNLPDMERWFGQFGDAIEWWKPECGAICFARYRSSISAIDLVERIRAEHSILLVPGEHFGLPRFLRFGFGNDTRELRAALEVLGPALAALIRD